MAPIFEDFVTVALREALTPRGGRSSLQHRDHLVVADLVPIRPDFVWSKDGEARIVADAKYKAEKPSGFPRADLYQMLAYCTTLGLPVGHLVYAKANEDAREHVVRGEWRTHHRSRSRAGCTPPAAVFNGFGSRRCSDAGSVDTRPLPNFRPVPCSKPLTTRLNRKNLLT